MNNHLSFHHFYCYHKPLPSLILSSRHYHHLEYHITIISTDRFYQVYSGTNQNYKVARLEENTTYHLRICASNEAGTGPFSPIASLSTTKAPPPLIKGRVSCYDLSLHVISFSC